MKPGGAYIRLFKKLKMPSLADLDVQTKFHHYPKQLSDKYELNQQIV